MSAARQAVRAAPGVAASMPLEAFAHGGAVPGWVAWPLLWIFARNAGDPSIPQWLGAIVWAGLTLYTWIVAAAYAVAVWAGRRRRSP